MKFQTLKKLLWILLLIILFILLTGSCTSTKNIINDNSTIVNALEVMLTAKEKVELININEATADMNEILAWAESICAKSIRDTNSYDFDYLLKKVDEINSIDPYLLPLVAKNKNLLLEAVINELRFRGLVAVQHNMEKNYQKLPANQKFARTIIFATTNTSISEIKTNLFFRQIGILENSIDVELKLRCWRSIQRMLDEIDIPMSETGDRIVQRSPYGLMIKKGEIFDKLDTMVNNEINFGVKSSAQNIILQLRSSDSKYKEFAGEIIIDDLTNITSSGKINEKALSYFNEALAEPGDNKKIELYTKAIDLDSNFTAAYNNRGISLFEIKDYGSAVKDFKKAIQLDPASVIVNSYLGNCYLKLEDYKSAVDFYSRAIQSGITDKSVIINRGFCYQKLNQFDLAVKDYTTAIENDPESVNAFINRAQCYTMLKEFDRAEKDYKELIKIDPANSVYYYNLGCIYWNKSEWQSVIEIWEKGLVVNPHDENILKNLPAVRTKLSKPKKLN